MYDYLEVLGAPAQMDYLNRIQEKGKKCRKPKNDNDNPDPVQRPHDHRGSTITSTRRKHRSGFYSTET